MNKRGIIISGGAINEAFALQMLREIQPEYVIGVDGGLSFLYDNQVMPTHVVGDFDSVDAEVLAYFKAQKHIEIRAFDPVKDASDTEIAIRLAIEVGAEKLWILGATGTRLDHVMANIQSLKIAHENGVQAYIVDACNRISLQEKEACLLKEHAFGEYFSIFPFGGIVERISIEGAKYPLKDYRLCPYDSRCVSNEMQENEVKITFPKGMIILMETRDKI